MLEEEGQNFKTKAIIEHELEDMNANPRSVSYWYLDLEHSRNSSLKRKKKHGWKEAMMGIEKKKKKTLPVFPCSQFLAFLGIPSFLPLSSMKYYYSFL